MNNKFGNGKEKLVGKMKETTGKMTNNEELELSGKMQAMKADFGNNSDDMKDEVIEKANDFVDRVKVNKKDNL